MAPYHHDDYFVRVSAVRYIFTAYFGAHPYKIAFGISYYSLKRQILW
jgi:hypothetical protein